VEPSLIEETAGEYGINFLRAMDMYFSLDVSHIATPILGAQISQEIIIIIRGVEMIIKIIVHQPNALQIQTVIPHLQT